MPRCNATWKRKFKFKSPLRKSGTLRALKALLFSSKEPCIRTSLCSCPSNLICPRKTRKILRRARSRSQHKRPLRTPSWWRSPNALTRTASTMPRICALPATGKWGAIKMQPSARTKTGCSTQRECAKSAIYLSTSRTRPRSSARRSATRFS